MNAGLRRLSVAGCGAGLFTVVALTACAANARRDADPPPASQAVLYTDAVHALITQGQYYAAIAHIQQDRRLHGDTAELKLLEADARRNLGQSRTAEALYQSLLREDREGPLAAEARHGLGRVYAATDLNASLRELREAARLKPTDIDIRNDYGYALMQAARYAEARIELSTAAELAPGDPKPRNNLLILLMLVQDENAVRRLAAQTQADEALLARLRAQAQSLKATRPRAG